MNPVSEGQVLGTDNAQGEVLTTGNGGTAVTLTPTTATAFQVSANRSADVYIEITTAAALGITMGPTSAGTGVTIASSESETLGVTTVHVPAGWYMVLTGTMADQTVTAVLN